MVFFDDIVVVYGVFGDIGVFDVYWGSICVIYVGVVSEQEQGSQYQGFYWWGFLFGESFDYVLLLGVCCVVVVQVWVCRIGV